MERIINPIVFFLELLIVYTYIADLFEKKYSTSKTIAVGTAIFILPYAVNEFFSNSVLNIIVFTIACFAFIFLTHKIKITQCIFHSVLISSIMLATELICFYAVSLIYGDGTFYAFRDSEEVYILDAITSKLLFLLTCKLCNQFKIKSGSKLYKVPLSYFIYGVTACFTLVILVVINSRYQFSPALQTLMIAMALLLLFSTIIQFISHEKIAAENAKLLELQRELHRKEISETYYKILDARNNELQRFSHDTKHHLSAILNLSNDKEVEEYINKIYADLEKYSSKGKSGNKMLDIVLHKYSLICESKEISFEALTQTANLDFMEATDLAAFIGNLLDNAVEAAEKTEEKIISLSVTQKNGFQILNCINSCDEKPYFKGEKLITTKKNTALHGHGTKTIEKLTKKYNGSHSFKYDDSVKQFNFTALFPINK